MKSHNKTWDFKMSLDSTWNLSDPTQFIPPSNDAWYLAHSVLMLFVCKRKTIFPPAFLTFILIIKYSFQLHWIMQNYPLWVMPEGFCPSPGMRYFNLWSQLVFQTLLKKEKTKLKKQFHTRKKLHSSLFCISGLSMVSNQLLNIA